MPFSDVPPSYLQSIDREAWTIIAPWVESSDLCSACLVSHKWHSIFVPFLWGDPASHFGIANDAVYVALTRFKRTLRKVRPSVRALTHTLHLPPALSEIYGGPNPTWLRDVLEYLPNLQSLIVTKLPFFDHSSLLTLNTTGLPRNPGQEEPVALPAFGLKLLLASSEPNTTSAGLVAALSRFTNLVYLDLSYTTPARDASVLAALSGLNDLQALKLRGVGMRDGEAEVLANAVGLRVRLLDLRDNFLTDMAVRSLMQASFLPLDEALESSRLSTRRVEDWPVGMAPGPDFFSLDSLRSEDFDHELLKQLTNPLTGRLAFEDIPHRGLTHLYIADNRLSVEGLSSLLKSERLHILDAGSVDNVKTITRTRNLNSATGYTDEVRFPGAEKLVPILAQAASKNLTYLRVDHAVVTAKADIKPNLQPKSSAVELAGSAPLATELPSESVHVVEAPAPAHYAVEMPTDEAVFELDATPAEPRYELVGDVIHFALSPPVGDKPEGEVEPEHHSPIRGEGAFAPEPVIIETNHENHGTDEDTGPDSAGTIISLQNSDENSTHSSRSLNSIISPVSPLVTNNFPSILDALPSTKTIAQRQLPPLAESVAVENGPSTQPPQPAPPLDSSETLAPATVQQVQNKSTLSPVPATSTARQARIDFLRGKRPASLTNFNPNASANGSSSGLKSQLQSSLYLTSLHPAALPNLRTLILTNVPLKVTKSSNALSSLKKFISACADESALSHLLAKTDYSLPPGRARHLAELKQARALFALGAIMLEMENPAAATPQGQPGWQHSRQHIIMSKSSTGDKDSENLWSAAENDFSFFGEEGEEQAECGIYQHDPDKYFPTSHLDDKIYLGPDFGNDSTPSGSSPHGSISSLGNYSMNLGRTTTVLKSPRDLPLGRNRRSSSEAKRRSIEMRIVTPELPGTVPTPKLAPPTSNPEPPTPEEPTIDLVAELAAWRRERKKAYEDEMARYRRNRSLNGVSGYIDPNDADIPFVEGHWKGEIKVIRNAAPKGRTGVVDMYGNYFEKGYLYP